MNISDKVILKRPIGAVPSFTTGTIVHVHPCKWAFEVEFLLSAPHGDRMVVETVVDDDLEVGG